MPAPYDENSRQLWRAAALFVARRSTRLPIPWRARWPAATSSRTLRRARRPAATVRQSGGHAGPPLRPPPRREKGVNGTRLPIRVEDAVRIACYNTAWEQSVEKPRHLPLLHVLQVNSCQSPNLGAPRGAETTVANTENQGAPGRTRNRRCGREKIDGFMKPARAMQFAFRHAGGRERFQRAVKNLACLQHRKRPPDMFSEE